MTKTLIAEFTVRPGHEDRVRQLVLELTDEVRAEPGNLVFDPCTREDNARAYVVYEVYRDAAAFEAHITAPYGKTFNDELALYIEEPESQLTRLTSVATS